MPVVNPGIRRFIGKVGGIPIANRVLHVDAAKGITAAADRISQWSDISGQAHHLLQASGGNQPIHLPIGVNDSGTAQAGSTGTTIVLASTASTVNDLYNGMTVAITAGTGAGQSKTITDYVGSTRVAMVSAWSVTPDNTSVYTVTASVPSVFFNGAAYYMKASAFTLNQPETVYLVAKQVSWTNTDYLFDGNTSNVGVLYQDTSSPRLNIYAGSAVGPNSDMTIGSNKVACVVFNGASSLVQINTSAAVTGNAGASNMGGFTLASNGAGGGGNWGNIQAHEVLIYNVAHDAATRANIIAALMRKWGVT